MIIMLTEEREESPNGWSDKKHGVLINTDDILTARLEEFTLINSDGEAEELSYGALIQLNNGNKIQVHEGLKEIMYIIKETREGNITYQGKC